MILFWWGRHGMRPCPRAVCDCCRRRRKEALNFVVGPLASKSSAMSYVVHFCSCAAACLVEAHMREDG